MPDNTTQPANPVTEPLSAADIQAARIATLKTLPTFMFCPGCGSVHFGNDMSYNADLSGRSYGNAWIGTSDIETECNEDDTNYDNMRYSCDHDDTDVTDELNTTVEYLNKLSRFATELNIDLRVIDRVTNAINNRRNSEFYVRVLDSRRLLLRYTTVINGQETEYNIINPLVLNIAIDMAVETEYEFNYNHPIYNEAMRKISEILAEIEREAAARAAVQNAVPAEQQPNAVRGRGYTFMNEAAMFSAAQSQMMSRMRPEQDPGDRDPFNSNVIQPNHHQRWRDTDTTAICTCEHCNYSFECASEIDLVTCPKCNKETTNV